MNTTQTIMEKQVVEGDLFILLLIESEYNGRGMTYREVAARLQMSPETVRYRYQRAAKRMDAQAAALFVTPIKKAAK
jgi:orotate phosphoribosyltransferase-like protein